MPVPLPDQRITTSRRALQWIAALTLLNLAFNVLSRWSGHGYPFDTFLWRPDDNFGDFFSLLHTYPGGGVAVVHDRIGLHAILPATPLSLGVTSDPVVTNFHMMPLSTVIDLGLVALLRWIDPVTVFVALFAGLVAGWGVVAWRFAASRREAMHWIGAMAFAYPLLMTLARGNLFAGLTALLLVQALLLGARRRVPAAAAAMLAIACNFRPNAILLAVPLLIFYWPHRWRFAAALGASGLAVLGASLAVATALYPAYTVVAIRAGLANYYTLYVGQGWGLAYGSSLYGALRILLGRTPGLEGAALGLSLAILMAGGMARLRGRIDDAVLIFLAVTSYCLGSTVLGDYHLMVCVAAPMALAATSDGGDPIVTRMHRAAMVASCVVLAPKNYLFIGPLARPVSLQVVINPLLMLGAAGLIMALACRRAPIARPVVALV